MTGEPGAAPTPERFASAGGCASPKPDARTELKCVAAVALEHQRHPIDEQRLHDARNEPIGEPVQIEIAVQVAGEADERTPIVVAIAIERAIEQRLHGVLDRRREQDGHERGEQRDHPLVCGPAVRTEQAIDALQQAPHRSRAIAQSAAA